MVTPDTSPAELRFPFVCPLSRAPYSIERDGPAVSEHVAIAGVINTSGVTIDLSEPHHDGPPVRLGSGEETTAFNGKAMGTIG